MKNPKIITTSEEFSKMTSSEICKAMQADRSFAIREDENGRRRIVQRVKNTY